MFILKSFGLSLCIPPALVAKVTTFSMLRGYPSGRRSLIDSKMSAMASLRGFAPRLPSSEG
jgi:hypothetical protein